MQNCTGFANWQAVRWYIACVRFAICLPLRWVFKCLDFEAQRTLSYALSSGILDLDRVHELCMASNREQAKALYPYSITPPSKEGERWRTNYMDRNGKRKTIRVQTEEALLDKLIPLYLDRENLDKKTFHELFEEWIAYKVRIKTTVPKKSSNVPTFSNA